MTKNIDIIKTAQMLKEKNNILIISHKNPDGDTISSAAALLNALKDLGKTAAVTCHDEFSSRYEFMNINIFNDEFQPEFIVSVDCATRDLLGSIDEKYGDKIDLSIDHHPTNTGYATYTCCYGKLPAAAQLIYYIIKEMGNEITPLIANCCYTGIVTDTGCFQFSSVDGETHKVATELFEIGVSHNMILDRFFMSKSKKTIELEKHALNNLEFYFEDKCAIITLDNDIMNELKPAPVDIEGISNIPRVIEGVEVGITIRAIVDGYKLSIRTNKDISASNIAQNFGGGGHTKAAGCVIKGDLDTVKKLVLEEVKKALCN